MFGKSAVAGAEANSLACAGTERALREAEGCLGAAAHWCGSSHGARVLRQYRRVPLLDCRLPTLNRLAKVHECVGRPCMALRVHFHQRRRRVQAMQA